MALESSGAMSLGGSTVGRSVNCELGFSGTAQICMNQTDVRDLVGISSGTISFSNFYGASAGPGIGDNLCGGYYTGTITVGAQEYCLIVAPNSTGCASCQGATACVSSGATDTNDGYNNTYSFLNSSTYPAANYTATRSIGGFSDWYTPACNEMNQMYTYKNSMPGGQGYSSGFFSGTYWSSTENYANRIWGREFGNGSWFVMTKSFTLPVRAIRRTTTLE